MAKNTAGEPVEVPDPLVTETSQAAVLAPIPNVIVVTTVALRDPHSGLRFNPNTPVEAPLTAWLQSQLSAGLAKAI